MLLQLELPLELEAQPVLLPEEPQPAELEVEQAQLLVPEPEALAERLVPHRPELAVVLAQLVEPQVQRALERQQVPAGCRNLVSVFRCLERPRRQ